MTKYVLACSVFLLLQACIVVPVEVRNTYDESGHPQPLAVAPEPQQLTLSPPTDGSSTGAWTGRIEAAEDAAPPAPAPAPFRWDALFSAILGLAGLAGGGWAIWAQKGASALKTALRITADLADAQERAQTDMDVEVNKRAAQIRQRNAGVEHLVQGVRSKPIKPRK